MYLRQKKANPFLGCIPVVEQTGFYIVVVEPGVLAMVGPGLERESRVGFEVVVGAHPVFGE